MDPREQRYLDMISQFPDSPLGYFSLAKYYLEVGRLKDAIEPLERCIREEQDWAAAMVALGDAYAGTGQTEKAIEMLEKARATALGQSHASLAEEIDEKLEDLR